METVKNIIHHDIGPQLYKRNEKKVIHERMPLLEWLKVETLYSRPMDTIDQSQVMRKVLLTESIDVGHEKTKEESAKKIPSFVEFFSIDMSQFKKEDPEDYKTFDDFFTREVKEGQRPIAEPEDESVVVSAADCRITVFNSLEETEKLWIKGKKFSFERLLGNNDELARIFRDGVVVNFRLAPQDYHRFHSPVSGEIVSITKLGGTLYNVKTKATHSDIDVLSENEREIIVIDTKEFGKVAYVAIGAEKVGLVKTLVKKRQVIKKGDELGYFHYGGSDIVAIFEKRIKWDDDLREYTLKGIETLLHANERIGKYQIESEIVFSG